MVDRLKMPDGFLSDIDIESDDQFQKTEKSINKKYRENRLNDYLAKTPLRYKNATLENYKITDQEQGKACLEIKKYTNTPTVENFVMLGKYGVGKTHLAYSILRDRAVSGQRVKYYTLASLFRELNNGEIWKSKAVLNVITRYDLIVIDEIGRTKWEDGQKNNFFEVLDSRYNEMKPTVLISNMSKKEFTDHLGVGLVSRLIDDFDEGGKNVLEMNWKNHRVDNGVNKKENHE